MLQAQWIDSIVTEIVLARSVIRVQCIRKSTSIHGCVFPFGTQCRPPRVHSDTGVACVINDRGQVAHQDDPKGLCKITQLKGSLAICVYLSIAALSDAWPLNPRNATLRHKHAFKLGR